MNKTNKNEKKTENATGIKRIYDKCSLGVLRLEMLVMAGVIGVCAVKAGSLFLI